MAEFTTIKASKAPTPESGPSSISTRKREYEDYVNKVSIGEAGSLVPGEDETARSITLRIHRAALRLGKNVDTWVRDGTVYFIVTKQSP